MAQDQTPGSGGMSRRGLLKAGALAAVAAPVAAPLLDTDPGALACDVSGPGVIPPPGSVTTPGPAAAG